MIPLRDKIVTKMTIIVMVIKAMITSLSWRESPTSEYYVNEPVAIEKLSRPAKDTQRR